MDALLPSWRLGKYLYIYVHLCFCVYSYICSSKISMHTYMCLFVVCSSIQVFVLCRLFNSVYTPYIYYIHIYIYVYMSVHFLAGLRISIHVYLKRT